MKSIPTNWCAQQLRLSVFFTEPVPSTTDWWAGIPVALESDENRPREGVRRLGGAHGGDVLSLQAIGGVRADLLLEPSIGAFPRLVLEGDVNSRIREFFGFGKDWLSKHSFRIGRVAFGAVLLEKSETHGTSYLRLNDLLKSVQVDPDSTEFMYQINRRVSSPDGTLLNRITKWAALRTSLGLVAGIESRPLADEYWVRLEADFSTAADMAGELSREHIGSVLEIFGDLLADNAERGDPA